MVSLILLIALTMLGISALQATKFETRMAASTREYNVAFENAERAIAEAVRYYRGQNLAQLPTESSFDTTIPVKVTKGESQFRIMVGATKNSSQNLQGGTAGARYYLVEGTGISRKLTEGGIPVTLYAGIVIDTPDNGAGNLTDNTNPDSQATNP